MNRNEFYDKLYRAAAEAGIETAETTFANGESFEVSVFEGEIERYSLSETGGISLRGIWQGEMGYAYSEILDEKAIGLLIEGVKQSASVISQEDKDVIYAGSPAYETVDVFNPALETVPADQKIEFALAVEAATKHYDARIDKVEAEFGNGSGERELRNSLGLALSDRSNYAMAYAEAVAKDGDNVQTGFEYQVTDDFSKLDAVKIGQTAAQRALDMLEAKPAPGGVYKAVLGGRTSAGILSAFSDIFSALSVDRGMSLLAGKVGEAIAASCITIVDDPFLAGGMASGAFDAEGVATKYKEIVKDGILTGYLHSLKTAAKFGVEPTGNASKASYKSPVDIGPSNMYFVPGEKTQDELFREIGEGIYITDVQGLHAGLNPISGDFSLSASGFLIQGGVRGRAVNQITIAGNYIDLLKHVSAVGADLEFGFPGGSYFGSPSLYISELNVAGE